MDWKILGYFEAHFDSLKHYANRLMQQGESLVYNGCDLGMLFRSNKGSQMGLLQPETNFRATSISIDQLLARQNVRRIGRSGDVEEATANFEVTKHIAANFGSFDRLRVSLAHP